VGGDGAFAEYFPSAWAKGEVDNGGWKGAAGGAAVDDEGNAVADLVAHASGVNALGRPLKVGRSGGDGKAEALDHGAWDGGVRDAECDIAGVGSRAERQPGASANDDGERTGPEALGEAVEQGIGFARELICLKNGGDEQRKRLVFLAGLDLVDLLYGAKVDGIDGEPVEGVGGEGNDFAFTQAGHDVVDPIRLRFIGMDAQNLRQQGRLTSITN